MSGQFGFMAKIGATDQAVAVLNDQPYLFTILVVVLVVLILQSVLIWYIHYATMKPEQKKKKEKKDTKKPGGKPPAARRLVGIELDDRAAWIVPISGYLWVRRANVIRQDMEILCERWMVIVKDSRP
ncbi:hypothetical protein F4677DRAFT_445777 [Hypoxylon crocopeplum]|nr:hypothetical protein F4677DRAFT_445777 [Hypoxylon crocopeplum]